MGPFKKYVLTAAGFAVLAGVISGITVAPAVAQAVKAALIKNVDEKGRVPYTASINCFDTMDTFCAGSAASAVPSGKRLVIEHVSAYSLLKGKPLNLVLSGNTYLSYVGATFNTNNGAFNFYVSNEPTLTYFEVGQTPSLGIQSDTVNVSMQAVITGYLVDLTI
jgi:hypothetical protein